MKGPINSALAFSKCPLILMLICNMVSVIRVQILSRVPKKLITFVIKFMSVVWTLRSVHMPVT